MAYELVDRQSDILRDLSQQNGRNVAAAMNRNCCASAVGMSKLFRRAALAEFRKSEVFQNGNDSARLENRDIAHIQLTVSV